MSACQHTRTVRRHAGEARLCVDCSAEVEAATPPKLCPHESNAATCPSCRVVVLEATLKLTRANIALVAAQIRANVTQSRLYIDAKQLPAAAADAVRGLSAVHEGWADQLSQIIELKPKP